MPHATAWPFWFAAALLFLFFMLLLEMWAFAVVAAVTTMVTMMGWFWPRGQTQET